MRAPTRSWVERTGTVTWLPKVGQVIREGQVLYRVDQAPVVLLYGSDPRLPHAGRGRHGRGRDRSGRGAAEPRPGRAGLCGHGLMWTRPGMSSTGPPGPGWRSCRTTSGWTRPARLSLGEVVFLPTAARVTTLQASLGAPATGPVLTASSTARTVSVALEPDLQSEVKAGDRVTITLPDGSTTPGRVTSVGTVATAPSHRDGPGGSDSGPTVPVHIRPTDPTAAGSLDQALVEVAITDQHGAQRAGGAGDRAARALGRRVRRGGRRRRRHAPPGAGDARGCSTTRRAWCRCPGPGWRPGSAWWCPAMSSRETSAGTGQLAGPGPAGADGRRWCCRSTG